MSDSTNGNAVLGDDRRAPRRLYRTTDDKLVAGVCGGLARYLNLDPTLVRVVVGLLTLFSLGFPGVIGYIVLIFVMPEQSPALQEQSTPGQALQGKRERSGNTEPASAQPVADPGPPPVFFPEEDENQTPWPTDPATLWTNAKHSAGEAAPGQPEQDLR